MFYSGESNVPGAPGNLMAGTPSFDINRRPGTLGGRSGEQLKRLYEGGTQQNEKLNEELRNRGILPGGPQLPMAFGASPNELIAQAYPGGQSIGNAAALGGMLQANPNFGPRPFNVDINAVDNRLESIGGSANIDLDANQRLRFGGSFNPAATDQMGMPVPQGYQVYGAYETPGFGLNVNYRNTGMGGMQPPGMMGGFPGEINAGFKGRFR